ncbi:MAG TPA: hypothetical protein VF510_20225 [Ktedonobacterales bacterium]
MIDETIKTDELQSEEPKKSTSRRAMLRLAAPVAAATALAATGVIKAGTVHAAPSSSRVVSPRTQGSAMIAGTSNTETESTYLINWGNTLGSGGNSRFPGTLDVEDSFVNPASGGDPVYAEPGYSYALRGRSASWVGTIGILGRYPGDTASGSGSLLKGGNAGVYGYVNHADADGNKNTGYGVIAQSHQGAAPLLLQGGFAGSPINGALAVDGNGVLLNRRYGAGYATSSLNFLSAPFRFVDTRGGSGTPYSGQGPWAANTNHIIQITGLHGVPSGAKAILGNVTVTQTAGNGYLRLYPAGAAVPGTSSINYVAGQTIANACVVGLSSGGALAIHVDGSSTQVILDIAGYVI